MCKNCEDGRTTDDQGGVICLTSGEPLWCVEYVSGLEMELRRVSRLLNSYAEQIVQYDALESTGGLYEWARKHRVMLGKSFEQLTSWYDVCERKLLALRMSRL